MKNLKYIFTVCLLSALFISCSQDYIDPINSVAPGEDKLPPVINITSPFNGQQIRVKPDIASITIEVNATDDIEVASVSVKLDGKEVSGTNISKDYRHFVLQCPYDELQNGTHTVIATATDKSGKTSSQTVNFEKIEAYKLQYPEMGEMFYMPFNNELLDFVSITYATAMGDGKPQYVTGKVEEAGKTGEAYQNSTATYLSFPVIDTVADVNLLTDEFSASFWYKLNNVPDRAGILSITPKGSNADVRKAYGFRFFRESGNGGQTFKLNAGDGTGGQWFDGGAAATLTTSDWVFISFAISKSTCTVYMNGTVVSTGTFKGIVWEGEDADGVKYLTTNVSIMSGEPNFTEWNHFSDLSLIDDLRFYSKALTQAQVTQVMNDWNK